MSEATKHSRPLLRRHKIFIALAMQASLSFLTTSVSAQVLIVKPVCGVAGSNISITGSGWAEPEPVCHYNFLFDGAVFAPQQPDGLFGPPNRGATIPAGASVGDHKIAVELRLDSDDSLLQCRQTKFKVVQKDLNPFEGQPELGSASTSKIGCQVQAGAPANTRINISFAPKDVCDLTPCTKLVAIQTYTQSGTKADGTSRSVTFSDLPAGCWANAAKADKDFKDGRIVDVPLDSPNPYYQTKYCGATGSVGPAGDKTVTMEDSPTNPDACYPADIQTLRLDFETNIFCDTGDDKGQHFGKITWHWTRDKGRKLADGVTEDPTGTITADPPTRDQPSSSFDGAVGQWGANHTGWTKPVPTPPTVGGDPCN